MGTKHAASGREWSGGGTTLAIAQQFLTISKVILGPAAPAAPRHGQVSGQAQVGNLWKPAWLGSATVPQWGHAACVVMLCSSHPFQLSHCSGDALKIPGLLFESWRTSSSVFTSILSKRHKITDNTFPFSYRVQHLDDATTTALNRKERIDPLMNSFANMIIIL